ncbi:MAG: hypothetical protein ACE5JB_00745 [bacterium]
MKKYEKIAILDNEFQAQVLEGLLKEKGIPHQIRSYHDLAYDGLFQSQKGWGHIEAPIEWRDDILSILKSLIPEDDEN